MKFIFIVLGTPEVREKDDDAAGKGALLGVGEGKGRRVGESLLGALTGKGDVGRCTDEGKEDWGIICESEDDEEW